MFKLKKSRRGGSPPVTDIAAIQSKFGGPPPYIGPKGGLWADPLHTVHWEPPQNTSGQSPGLENVTGPRSSSSRGVENSPMDGESLGSQDSSSQSKNVDLFGGEGIQVPDSDIDEDFIESLGLDAESMVADEFSGGWSETSDAEPESFDIDEARSVDESLSRLREARINKKLPDDIIKIASGCLFYCMYYRVNKASYDDFAEVGEELGSYLEKPESYQGRSIFKIFGKMIDKLSYKSNSKIGKRIFKTLKTGCKKYPEDGIKMRDWMLSQVYLRGFDVDIISLALRILGYTDVSVLSPNNISQMIGVPEEDAIVAFNKVRSDIDSYKRIEDHIENTASWNDEDPESIRRILAEWRIGESPIDEQEIQKILWNKYQSIFRGSEAEIFTLSLIFAFIFNTLKDVSLFSLKMISQVEKNLIGESVEKSFFKIIDIGGE
jgi:hypothetical protein